MDLGLVIVPNWLLVLLLITWLYYKYLTWNFNEWKKRGVLHPGTQKPFVGDSFMMMKTSFIGHDTALVKKWGRCFGFYEFRTPVLMVSDPQLLKQIFVKDSIEHFTDRRPDTKRFFNEDIHIGLSVAEGEHWKHLRSHLTPTFSSGKLKKMMDLLNSVANNTVRNLAAKAAGKLDFEAREIYGSYTLDAVASTLFGIDIDSQAAETNEFVEMAAKAFSLTTDKVGFLLLLLCPDLTRSSLFKKLFKMNFVDDDSLNFFFRIIRQTLDLRKRQGLSEDSRPDMINLMLTSHLDKTDQADDVTDVDTKEGKNVKHKQGLTEKEIEASAVVFFLAGYETTATALGFVGYVLTKYPDIQAKVTQEIDDVIADRDADVSYEEIGKLTYLEQVIFESMRMWPPIARTDRVCTADVTLENGVRLVAGDLVAVPIAAIHQDPEFYPEPELFRPERFSPEEKKERSPYVYLPFGAGPRNCIGMRLALLEMKLALAKTLLNFRFVPPSKVQSDKDINTFRQNGLTYPKKGIQLCVQRR